MTGNFKALILTHQNAPLNIREMVAMNETEVHSLLTRLKEYTDLNDLLILSTCNRMEIYFSSKKTSEIEVLKILAIEKQINNLEEVESYFTFINDSKEAIRHLFRVSLGLESSVVGDMQISNQVKKAYQLTADLDLAGPLLHRLMHTIFFTNKRVVQETPFRDGSASISYLAADLASDIVKKISEPRVLVLGTGMMGGDVCRNLRDLGIDNVMIVNRTASRAIEVAEECDFGYLPFSKLKSAVENADVIISSVNIDKPLITQELLNLSTISHKVFIDISVPRSVDKLVNSVPGVIVYNVDELESKASAALTQRMNAIPQVESLIEENIGDFEDWSKEMMVSPTINKLKSALEDIRRNEIARHLKNLSEDEVALINKVTSNLMQKIIKLPALELKAACKRGEAETLIDVLNDLFDLEKEKDTQQKG